MTPIIAGRFEQNDRAEAAAEALRRAGRFDAARCVGFFCQPARAARDVSDRWRSRRVARRKACRRRRAQRRGAWRRGGRRRGARCYASAWSCCAACGSWRGRLRRIAGRRARRHEREAADTEPAEEGGEAVVVATSPGTASPVRAGGVLVAVRAVDFAKRVDAVNILRSAGAQDIERADGTWEAGHWIDFDPLKPPLLVDLPPSGGVSVRR